MAAFFNNIVLELPDITKIEFKKIDRKYFKQHIQNTPQVLMGTHCLC